ncbi:MAG TPA: class I adenylate-forming enzyme family protein [Actinocrinis sp.]|jgi:acyl-coenzyme A synthetase/AMP-(fatty) acid ligase
MSQPNIRTLLAADPETGAGNVLTTRIRLGIGLDEPKVCFDTEVDGRAAWEPFTVRELDRAVRARAAALHDLGVWRRDPVAVYASSAADNILSFLALTRLGAIPALVNPNLDADKAAVYIGRLRAAGVLLDREHRIALADHDCGTPLLPDISGLSAGDPEMAPEPYRHWSGDPVAITHSSGTTGMPKAVVHGHGSLYAAIRHRLSLPVPQGTDRILNALPSPHAATLIAINQALSFNAEIANLSTQAGAQVLEAIEQWKPHAVFGFAVTWADLARFDLAQRQLDSVSIWWNTGDCAHEAHIRRLVAVGSRVVSSREGRVTRPGSVFIDGIGSSEMGHSHFHITHTAETDKYGRCVGRPHPFVDCEVLDPDGNALGPGEVGELGTRSPTLALGYWNDSATYYRTRVNGYFLTGDLMYRDEDGYYYHVDRAVDSLDLGGGRRLFTAQSEERVLAACPDVLDCTLVAWRDGEAVVSDLLLQLADGADRARDGERAREVVAALDGHVAATVRDVIVVEDDSIPLGPTGKVRKFLLRQRHLEERGAGK